MWVQAPTNLVQDGRAFALPRPTLKGLGTILVSRRGIRLLRALPHLLPDGPLIQAEPFIRTNTPDHPAGDSRPVGSPQLRSSGHRPRRRPMNLSCGVLRASAQPGGAARRDAPPLRSWSPLSLPHDSRRWQEIVRSEWATRRARTQTLYTRHLLPRAALWLAVSSGRAGTRIRSADSPWPPGTTLASPGDMGGPRKRESFRAKCPVRQIKTLPTGGHQKKNQVRNLKKDQPEKTGRMGNSPNGCPHPQRRRRTRADDRLCPKSISGGKIQDALQTSKNEPCQLADPGGRPTNSGLCYGWKSILPGQQNPPGKTGASRNES